MHDSILVRLNNGCKTMSYVDKYLDRLPRQFSTRKELMECQVVVEELKELKDQLGSGTVQSRLKAVITAVIKELQVKIDLAIL